MNRINEFRSRVATTFQGAFFGVDTISLETLLPEVNRGLPMDQLFGTEDAEQVLKLMNDANDLMYSDQIVVSLLHFFSSLLLCTSD